MRKPTGGVFISLDRLMQPPGGRIEDPTGGFADGGWVTGFFDGVLSESIGE